MAQRVPGRKGLYAMGISTKPSSYVRNIFNSDTMEKKHYCDVIDLDEFVSLLEKYDDRIPAKLAELEEQRLQTIPRKLSEREDAHLEKSEVQTLVDWKLAHGTFRPSLRKLVGSNEDEAVVESTRTAFSMYGEDAEKWDKAVSGMAKELRGIGPATASLLLNTYDGEGIPFFSDELFRWVNYAEGRGHGWDRKIKYSMAEYRDMFERVESLRERLSKEDDKQVTCIEVEKVAYVLGRSQHREKRKAGDEEGVADQKRRKD